MTKALSLFNVFSSHMVLQREEKISFSGTGEAGKAFTVNFAGNTQSGTVAPDGKWQAVFAPLPAGGPYTLDAGYIDSAPSVHMEDILIGDVWYCSGQSNMEMPVQSDSPFWYAANAEEEAANANYPQIRLCNCMCTPGRKWSPNEVQEDEMDCIHWETCSPESVKPFSALGYFFGRKLHKDMNIPIGLIANAVGGTRLEAWISDEKLRSDGFVDTAKEELCPYELKEKLWKELYNGPSILARQLRQWCNDYDALGHVDNAWLQCDFDDSDWQEETGTRLIAPKPSRTLFRLSFTLPDDFQPGEYIAHIGVMDDCDHCYMNGEFIGETTQENCAAWAVDRRYPIPKNCLHPGKNVLSIVLDDQCNFGYIAAGNLALEGNGTSLPLQFTAKSKPVFIVPDDFPLRPPFPSMDCPGTVFDKNSSNYQSTLFNTLENPWFKYNIKGTIWYQGCTKSGDYTYYTLHRMLIEEMREKWHKPEMPFLLVQLAAWVRNYPAIGPHSEEDDNPCSNALDFAVTREIQHAIARNIPNTGMITAFDRGEANDIHPRDKQTLGFRLALKAENMIGFTKQNCDGPEFISYKNYGTHAVITFKNADGLHTTDGLPPKGFSASGPSGIFIKANAKIDGNKVIVSSPSILSISNVRYAFTNFCTVNLVNADGFPALPFRTDQIDYSTWK